MSTALTIPQRTLLGPGSVATGDIASDVKQYVLVINQVSWPHVGDTAFDIWLEYSRDGSAWQAITHDTMMDAAEPATRVVPANSYIWVVPLPDLGQSGRRLRARWDFAKSLTITGSLQVN